MEETIFTPDADCLEVVHLVLECGPIAKDIPAYASGFVVEKMALWVTDGLAIPIRMEGAARVRVCGTLYQYTRQQLIKLDKRKQNGVWFRREMVDCWVKPDEKHRAWIYVGINEYWENRLCNEAILSDNGWERKYRPAPRFQDENPLFHQAARYSKERIEDAKSISRPLISPDMYKAIQQTVKEKNDEEVQRLYDELKAAADAAEAKSRAAARAAAPFFKRILMPK